MQRSELYDAISYAYDMHEKTPVAERDYWYNQWLQLGEELTAIEEQYTTVKDELYYDNGLSTLSSLAPEEKSAVIKWTAFECGFVLDDEVEYKTQELERICKDVKQALGSYNYDRMIAAVSKQYNAVAALYKSASDEEFARNYGVLADATSILYGTAGSILSVADALDKYVSDIPIDKHASAYDLSNSSRIISDVRGQYIREEYGDLAADVHGLATGVASNAVSFIPYIGVSLQVMTSATNAFLDAKERGVNDGDAILTGVAIAACEMFFEKFSIDAFNKTKNIPAATKGELSIKLAKAFGTNAVEEGATTIAQAAFDYLINGDLSLYGSIYNSYINDGDTPEEAIAKVKKQLADDIVRSMIAGGLSGEIMMAGYSSADYKGNYKSNIKFGSLYTNDNGTVNTQSRDVLIGQGLASADTNTVKYGGGDENRIGMSIANDIMHSAMRGETLTSSDIAQIASDERLAVAFNTAFGTDIDFKSRDAYSKANSAIKKGEAAWKEQKSGEKDTSLQGSLPNYIEKEKESDIIKEKPVDEKPYAKARPKFTHKMICGVWERCKDPITGKIYDPTGKEITWDRTKARKGQWDMGHIPGEKYSDKHKLYMEGKLSKADFLSWYYDPANYRPELPSTNRSHKYE